MKQHPINPPPELVQQLCDKAFLRGADGISRGEIEVLLIQEAFQAGAALAEQPVGPTESDVTELFYRHVGEGSEVGFENAIAEALALWGAAK